MPKAKTPSQNSWLFQAIRSFFLLFGGSLAVFFALISMEIIAKQFQEHPLLQPLRGIIQNITPQNNTLPVIKTVSTEEVSFIIDSWRAENTVATLSAHVALEKYARLITLEIADQETLAIGSSQDILNSITTRPPQKVEILSLFAPAHGEFEFFSELSSEEVLLREDLTAVGIATRSATLQGAPGTIITVALSSTFPEKEDPYVQKSISPQPPARPTFTGEDLWRAVQDYRRAHGLSEFSMSTELCTVASIRLNEQLELGRLDNHDGFDARADEFFEKNPGWTGINENLATGYTTATQTVEWGWDQSLGHKALIQSREFPKACTAANAGFAVLVTGK